MSATPAPFREIAILGPGLLGASLAWALQSTASVRLWGRRYESLADAESRGLATVCTTDLAKAVNGVDLVVFCTPVEAMGGIARQIQPYLGEATVVTDVGSVKRTVMEELEVVLGADHFLGSHPMAGSEQSGSTAARADLFYGAACILTPTSQTSPALVERLTFFWQSLGCEIHLLDPAQHDRQIGLISHLPHLLAACLVNTISESHPPAMALAGQGFRDTTRIASGPPAMWTGILQANREEILQSLLALEAQIQLTRQHLRNGDDVGLHKFLSTAKTKRDGIIRKVRYGGH